MRVCACVCMYVCVCVCCGGGNVHVRVVGSKACWPCVIRTSSTLASTTGLTTCETICLLSLCVYLFVYVYLFVCVCVYVCLFMCFSAHLSLGFVCVCVGARDSTCGAMCCVHVPVVCSPLPHIIDSKQIHVDIHIQSTRLVQVRHVFRVPTASFVPRGKNYRDPHDPDDPP